MSSTDGLVAVRAGGIAETPVLLTSMKRSTASGMRSASLKRVAVKRYCAANSAAANSASSASGSQRSALPPAMRTKRPSARRGTHATEMSFCCSIRLTHLHDNSRVTSHH